MRRCNAVSLPFAWRQARQAIERRRVAPFAQIKVKTLTGKEIEIDIEADDTIARIKERVEVPRLRHPPIAQPRC
eukprot:2531459-Prymnesium_polylepis.1